jgi:hypothetical protein
MSADRWQTLDRLFIEALQLPAEARAALLARECGTDEQLRREVLSLLTAVDSSGTFLERPALERLARAMAGDGWSLRQGERLIPTPFASCWEQVPLARSGAPPTTGSIAMSRSSCCGHTSPATHSGLAVLQKRRVRPAR